MRIERINQILTGSLQDIVYRFWDNPYEYLNKFELQAELYGFLSSRIRCASTTGSIIEDGETLEQRTTTIVKGEYPAQYAFDLAIVNPAADQRLDIHTLPLLGAIEIVFQRDPGMDDVCQSILDDRQKLQRYWIEALNSTANFIGAAVVFFHRKDRHAHFLQYVKATPVEEITLEAGVNGIVVFEDGLLKF